MIILLEMSGYLMKIIINSKNVAVDKIIVSADIRYIARQFTLYDIDSTMNYNIGDIVEIYNDKDVLLISAEIEYIKAKGSSTKSEFIYAGRNKAKYIVDCNADKTIQFTEGQRLKTVISEIAGSIGLEVKGNADLPKDAMPTILIGQNMGKFVTEISRSAGKVITSDAKGNLTIEKEAKKKGKEILEYGVNIRSRDYTMDTTQVQDMYKVVSQSNYLTKNEQDTDVFGKFGKGKFGKVITSTLPLTPQECEKIAEVQFNIDTKKAMEYSAIVDIEDLELNSTYSIKDPIVGIDEDLNLKSIDIIITAEKQEIKAGFEKVL